MFPRVFALALILPLVVVANSDNRRDCPEGDYFCCKSTINSSSTEAQTRLLAVGQSDVSGPVGLECAIMPSSTVNLCFAQDNKPVPMCCLSGESDFVWHCALPAVPQSSNSQGGKQAMPEWGDYFVHFFELDWLWDWLGSWF